MAGTGSARHGRQGLAWNGELWRGKAWQARFGVDRRVLVGLGGAWQARRGLAWRCAAGYGKARQGFNMTKQIGFHVEDEQEWEKALRDLEEREGELIPETVVKEASDEASPLHS